MYPIQLKDDLLFPLEQTFNKFFEDFFNNKSNLDYTKSNQGYPKINCYKTQSVAIGSHDTFTIVFAVPGMNEADIDLEYNDDNSITIKGKMSGGQVSSLDSVTYYLRELRQSQFERTIKLPFDVKGQPTSAILKNGLLTVSWSLKPKEKKEKKKISIEKN